jgi:hypothetical protein
MIEMSNTPPVRNRRAATAPSTCISSYPRPPASTSKKTGGKAIGTDAEASSTLRKSSSDAGRPLAAIRPMFQMTNCCASRSTVPT